VLSRWGMSLYSYALSASSYDFQKNLMLAAEKIDMALALYPNCLDNVFRKPLERQGRVLLDLLALARCSPAILERIQHLANLQVRTPSRSLARSCI